MNEVDAGELLRELTFLPLPDGWTPVGAVVLVKCTDPSGEVTWSFRTTETLNDEELLGALTVRHAMQRDGLVAMYHDRDTGEDDESGCCKCKHR